jgi:hypothetical protein
MREASAGFASHSFYQGLSRLRCTVSVVTLQAVSRQSGGRCPTSRTRGRARRGDLHRRSCRCATSKALCTCSGRVDVLAGMRRNVTLFELGQALCEVVGRDETYPGEPSNLGSVMGKSFLSALELGSISSSACEISYAFVCWIKRSSICALSGAVMPVSGPC